MCWFGSWKLSARRGWKPCAFSHSVAMDFSEIARHWLARLGSLTASRTRKRRS